MFYKMQPKIFLCLLLVAPIFFSLAESRYIKHIEPYLEYNSKQHKTEDFYKYSNVSHIILRRGASFRLRITLNREWVQDKGQLKLVLSYGRNPSEEEGSLLYLPLRRNKNFSSRKYRWGVDVYRNDGVNLVARIYIPANAAIGSWNLGVWNAANKESWYHRYDENVIIFFNPWSEDDEVYWDDEISKEDFVLSDVGKYFTGTSKRISPHQWIYGQVNSNDDGGVLVGRWKEPYEPYKAPWEWTGSASILLQYRSSDGVPVRYGQCWVFANLLATLCRIFGIPARVVTNYGSGHDSNQNLRIEKYYDENGKEVKKGRDSVWNFHVWTEVWFARYDLKNESFSGWQVIDGTPQERASSGVYKMGPTSVLATKEGYTRLRYEAPYLYAEVNADYYEYVFNPEKGVYIPGTPITDYIGRLIVTQKAGSRGRNLMHTSNNEYVTRRYKYKEHTLEERESYRNACLALGISFHSTSGTRLRNPHLNIRLEAKDDLIIGETVKMKLFVQLAEAEQDALETVAVNLAVTSVDNGIESKEVKTASYIFNLKPEEETVIEFEVTADEYFNKLTDFSAIKVVAVGKMNSTGSTAVATEIVDLALPTLDLKINGSASAGQHVQLMTTFRNPTDHLLTDCELEIESLYYGPVNPYIGIIPAKSVVEYQELVNVEASDTFTVKLNCKELKNISGKLDVLLAQEVGKEIPVNMF